MRAAVYDDGVERTVLRRRPHGLERQVMPDSISSAIWKPNADMDKAPLMLMHGTSEHKRETDRARPQDQLLPTITWSANLRRPAYSPTA